MPFKSKAQWRKFGVLMREGKISRATFDEFAHDTDFSKLPDTHPDDEKDHGFSGVRSYMKGSHGKH